MIRELVLNGVYRSVIKQKITKFRTSPRGATGFLVVFEPVISVADFPKFSWKVEETSLRNLGETGKQRTGRTFMELSKENLKINIYGKNL